MKKLEKDCSQNIKKIDCFTLYGSKLVKLIENMNDIIYIADYDGIIRNANNYGKSKGYRTLQELFCESENEEIYKKIIDTVKNEGRFDKDIEIIKNGEKNKIYVIAYNMQSKKKIFVYVRDNDEYSKNENVLLEKIDRDEEHLKSKDLFIANLSHEIRTPINIIVGMIYFLKDTALDEKQLEYINKLDDASNLLLEMVNGILDLSEGKDYSTANTKSDFNLKQFIDGILEMFSGKIKEKDLKLYANLDIEENVNVHADKSRLSQVFINLIGNAVKYTEKGFIELDGKKIEENNVSYRFQFCLKDTGIGIKKEDTLRIFREFQQVDDPTRKTKDGKGMGLAIARKIVEDMNGKMWVESSIGLGSKFYFNISIDKSSNVYGNIPKPTFSNYKIEEKHADYNDENIKTDSIKRILLVEDNDFNIEITTKIIDETDYKCDVAKDGIEAIKKVKEVGNNYYSLILMDIHMPKYNGYEISKILKNDLDVNIPIVALTATSITPSIIEENKEYIAGYIQKPIKPVELKEKLRAYLENKAKSSANFVKKNILLVCDNDSAVSYFKNKLRQYFNVASTKSELDAQILLETGNIDAILVDELKNIDDEFKLINSIKCDSNYSKIPIILINRNNEYSFKQKAFELEIEYFIENFEMDKCENALINILNKLEKEDELQKIAKKSKEETENVYNFLFESMVNLTTSRSKETGEHLKRTQLYMKVMLSKYEEFYKEGKFTSKDVIEDIGMAAVLHDIGKVGIPDNVLNKPGKLTDEEYEIIKSHVIIGRNILETSYGNKVNNNILTFAKDIVYHHHEKFDGSGYPEKLKGEEISVISRIMALIDVYDALANDRVYKKALPYEEVEQYIQEQSGKAFDPKIVNVFMLVKDEIKKINEANKDKTLYKGE